MGRKSSEKAARRAKMQKEEEERQNASIEASMGIPSIAELEIEKQKRETCQSAASSSSSTTSGSTSARRGPSNKYSYDELKQLVESGEDEFGYRCFCNHVLNTEDVHESIVDDPQFRELYLHMNKSIQAKEQLGLNDGQYLALAKGTNTTGTDPDEIIKRYIKKKKDLQAGNEAS